MDIYDLIISAAIGAAVASFLTYRYSITLHKIQSKRVTDLVLTFIHSELNDNFANRICNNFPYNLSSLKGFELISLKSEYFEINVQQLAQITEMYTFLDALNNKIKSTKEAKYYGRNITKLDQEVKKLQELCEDKIDKYQKIYCKEKNIV
jgi:valyl-tRNA synthetase